jgi:septum formation protein
LIPPQLILASTSVYRRALLERLHLSFTMLSPDVDESPLHDELPVQTAMRLAEAKAFAITPVVANAVIIGSDQVAVLNGKRLGKPGSHAVAVQQLRAMRGQHVDFHTALCLRNLVTRNRQLENVPTTVKFRNYTDAQIEHYLHLEQPYDCAGSAKVEGLGIALVERIDTTDPTALIGLPLIALVRMLHNEGITVI